MSNLVESAKEFLGVPYVYGGNGKNGIDCSGLTQQAYADNGISIPRVAQDQYNASTKIEREDLQPGDLIFMSNTNSTDNITHVVMYAGDNKIIEAPRTGLNVRMTSLNGRSNIVGYGTFTGSGEATYNEVSNDTTPVQLGSSGGGLLGGLLSLDGIRIQLAETFGSVLSKIVKFTAILILAVIAYILLQKSFK